MKTGKKYKSVRQIIARFKSLHIEHGRIAATKEYDEKLKILSTEFQKALLQRDISHEKHVALLVKQEKVFEEKTKELQEKINEIKETLESIKINEARVSQYAKNLEASWHDEKVKKWMALNHDKNEAKILLKESENFSRKYV